MMYDRDGHDWGWGTWLGMGLMMTVLAVLVVAAVVLVVRATTGPQKATTSLPPETPTDTPRQHAQRVLVSGSLAATSTKASTSPPTCSGPADRRCAGAGQAVSRSARTARPVS